ADEAALWPFGAANADALGLRALAADGETAIAQAHVERVAADAGKVERQQILALVLVDVRGGNPVGSLDLALVRARVPASLRGLLEQSVHVILQGEEVARVEPVSGHFILQRNDECGMMSDECQDGAASLIHHSAFRVYHFAPAASAASPSAANCLRSPSAD